MKIFRGQPDNWVWKPTPREAARIWFGFSFMFYVLAAQEIFWPGYPQTTGRWGWLHRTTLEAFGPNGEVILYSVIGTACLMGGVWKHVVANRIQ